MRVAKKGGGGGNCSTHGTQGTERRCAFHSPANVFNLCAMNKMIHLASGSASIRVAFQGTTKDAERASKARSKHSTYSGHSLDVCPEACTIKTFDNNWHSQCLLQKNS